jgi:AmmeMemoRadiSam system protein B
MAAVTDLRPSPIAGQWYSSDPGKLAQSIDGYITAAGESDINGEILGIIVPHAGHRYSGLVAGYAFSLLRGLQPEIVAVVSPMHHPSAYSILTADHEAYLTPLGSIEIDRGLVNRLDGLVKDDLGYGITAVKNDPEHSLEIELPFLQRTLEPGYKLLPVMVRDPMADVTKALGTALAKVLASCNSLLVASTDLSHFYSQSVAEVLDAEMMSRIESFDPGSVLQAEQEGKGYACGRGAVATVLWAARGLGADKVKILKYATSGDITGDYSQVVGYASAVITRT